MEFVHVTEENLAQEHICCSITEKKGENSIQTKKDWLRERMSEGLCFVKANVRGKVFIEYIPAENAWLPIEAPGYMHINCLWISGQYKGQGYSNELLNLCIQDAKAKGKTGLTILSAKKKMPFLADPKYLKYKGFLTADKADPYFELLYFPFDASASIPAFKSFVHAPSAEKSGFALYYTNQCPFTEKYTHVIQEIAAERNIPFVLKKITTVEEAQSAPAPSTTYSIFYNGEFLTNEILSDKKFLSMLDKMGL